MKNFINSNTRNRICFFIFLGLLLASFAASDLIALVNSAGTDLTGSGTAAPSGVGLDIYGDGGAYLRGTTGLGNPTDEMGNPYGGFRFDANGFPTMGPLYAEGIGDRVREYTTVNFSPNFDDQRVGRFVLRIENPNFLFLNKPGSVNNPDYFSSSILNPPQLDLEQLYWQHTFSSWHVNLGMPEVDVPTKFTPLTLNKYYFHNIRVGFAHEDDWSFQAVRFLQWPPITYQGKIGLVYPVPQPGDMQGAMFSFNLPLTEYHVSYVQQDNGHPKVLGGMGSGYIDKLDLSWNGEYAKAGGKAYYGNVIKEFGDSQLYLNYRNMGISYDASAAVDDKSWDWSKFPNWTTQGAVVFMDRNNDHEPDYPIGEQSLRIPYFGIYRDSAWYDMDYTDANHNGIPDSRENHLYPSYPYKPGVKGGEIKYAVPLMKKYEYLTEETQPWYANAVLKLGVKDTVDYLGNKDNEGSGSLEFDKKVFSNSTLNTFVSVEKVNDVIPEDTLVTNDLLRHGINDYIGWAQYDPTYENVLRYFNLLKDQLMMRDALVGKLNFKYRWNVNEKLTISAINNATFDDDKYRNKDLFDNLTAVDFDYKHQAGPVLINPSYDINNLHEEIYRRVVLFTDSLIANATSTFDNPGGVIQSLTLKTTTSLKGVAKWMPDQILDLQYQLGNNFSSYGFFYGFDYKVNRVEYQAAYSINDVKSKIGLPEQKYTMFQLTFLWWFG